MSKRAATSCDFAAEACTFPEAVRLAILEHALREAPREACGLLVGSGRWIRRADAARNLSDTRDAYAIDPLDLLRASQRADLDRLAILGVYHSHPFGPAHPSLRDLAAAQRLWPTGSRWLHAILSLQHPAVASLTLWRLAGGRFAPVAVRAPIPSDPEASRSD